MPGKLNAAQQMLVEPELPKALMASTPMELLSLALNKESGMDVIERMAALLERQQDRDAEREFNAALELCQSEVELVVVDSDKTGPGGKKWATYKALDRAIRPIYLRHGFSISFGSADCSMPGYILVTCHVSHRGGHTRLYRLPMDASGEGAKGGGALSKPHAILAAMEYGRRCLLKSVFNIVTGEEDALTNGELAEQVEWIQNAKDPEELKKIYKNAYAKFEAVPSALKIIIAAKNERRKDFE